MRPDLRAPRPHGFTVVELVIAMVVFGLLAATLVIFVRPAVTAYQGARTRAGLVEDGDQALRRMLREVQSAVPNSIRTPSTDCFELVPTLVGGRARLAPDTVNAGSAALDTTAATTQFDVLTPLTNLPAVGDWVVVGNQNPADVHGGANRSDITAISPLAANLGRMRIAVRSKQFPLGYDGGRFVVVPASQTAVFYVCSGADGTLDASGNGKGTLYRMSGYGFNATAPTACPGTSGAPVLASQVRSCRFVYDPNQGATQQNGFVSIQLELARDNETASLVLGAHVVNAP